MAQAVLITVSDLAEQAHMNRATLYDLANRADDPMPLRTLHGFKRSSALIVSEFEEWYMRNSDLFRDAEH